MRLESLHTMELSPLGTDKYTMWQGAQPARSGSLPCSAPRRALVFAAFQYDYMGADKDAVTAKMVQLFSYLNSVSGLGRILNVHGKSAAVVQIRARSQSSGRLQCPVHQLCPLPPADVFSLQCDDSAVFSGVLDRRQQNPNHWKC